MGSEVVKNSIQWIEFGFTIEEQERINSFQRGPDTFPLAVEIRNWQQWVTEIKRGELLTADEIESVYNARDDVEDSCAAIDPGLRDRLYAFLDSLDAIYRDATVFGSFGNIPVADGRWWRGRIPVNNRARAYMLEDSN
jgi:hypothetical protein